jgi:hypothetical protein
MSRLNGLVKLTAALALALVWAGCSCRETEPAGPNVVVAQPNAQAPAQPQPQPAQPRQEPGVGDSVLRAPGDYLRTTVITAPRQMKRDLDNATANKEVQEFNALEGRYPYSLKELEDWRGAPLSEAPKGYTYKYDSTTGKVSVVPIN